MDLFGGLRLVTPDGASIDRFATQKSAGLLAYLALHPRSHAREVLAELFWPDKDPPLARNSLSAALSDLRPLIGAALVTSKLQVGLDPRCVATDVAEFEARLTRGDVDGARRIAEAELLPGFYDDWVIVARERLQARLERCADAARAGGGPDGRLHGLPPIETALIGREAEGDVALGVLRGASRLLTVRGMGGVGKTRLAQDVARQCGESFPGGVYWVPLDDVRTGDGLLRAVAAALGMGLQPQPSPTEQFGRRLAGQGRALLVLDNVEQIPDGPQAVLGLLTGAPECCCLVTSRRALGLRAEVMLELSPLPLPDAERLFRERAAATQLGRSLPADAADSVTRLCRQLDGLPLALELAAARIASLTPQQMLDRFDERFRLLQSKAIDIPERHRTLRAAIAWSYDALCEDERRLLMQLAVFVGGFSLADAEAVCAGDDTLEGLLALRDSSLVSLEARAPLPDRFLLLESLRHFAAERLAESPELQRAVRRRHAERYLDAAEAQLARLRTRGEADALRRLDALAANLGAALDVAEDDLAPCLALALARPLQRRGFFVEAAAALERGLSTRRPPELLWERAGLHFDQGEYPAAARLAREARSLYDAQGDAEGVGRCENLLGQIRYKEKRWDDARAHLALAEGLAVDPVEVAIVQNNQALVELEAPDGDADRAVDLLTRALAVRQAQGDLRGIAAVVANLGNLAFAREDWDAARRHFTESLEVEAELDHHFGIARALNNLGEAVERLGDSERALRGYLAAHQLFADLRHEEYALYTRRRAEALAAPAERVAALRAHLRPHSAGELAQEMKS